MGFKVRRSKKIAPGLRISAGKKSVGMSIGGKAARINLNSKRKPSVTIKTPIKGASYTTTIGGSKKRKSAAKPKTAKTAAIKAKPETAKITVAESKPKTKGVYTPFGALVFWISLALILVGIFSFTLIIFVAGAIGLAVFYKFMYTEIPVESPTMDDSEKQLSELDDKID